MRQRCLNPNTPKYKFYGGRGVTVCERWNDFANFLADMGERPPGATLDRIDTNGNYEPGNCRWLSLREQQHNKRTSRFYEREGLRLTVKQWVERLGLDEERVRSRLKLGWTFESAIGEPVVERVRDDEGRFSPADIKRVG